MHLPVPPRASSSAEPDYESDFEKEKYESSEFEKEEKQNEVRVTSFNMYNVYALFIFGFRPQDPLCT